jgi:hypothetical protein
MQVKHFVLVRGADLREGESYLVTSPSIYIWSPRQKVWGQQWQINGVVRVVSLVNSQDKLFRAQVMEAYTQMEKDSILTLGVVPDITLENFFVGQGVEIEAQVVGGAGGSPRSMFSRGEILYLDAGKLQGVVEGQGFQIFRNENQRSENLRGLVRQNAREIGLVRIIQVAEKFSTAVVIDSNEEIRVGDQTTAQLKSF